LLGMQSNQYKGCIRVKLIYITVWLSNAYSWVAM
jgi:hypothetical protein